MPVLRRGSEAGSGTEESGGPECSRSPTPCARSWTTSGANMRRSRRPGQSPFVFQRRGKRIKDFRAAWAVACKAAGFPGRIPQDLRRSAVRNMDRLGLSRSVAMRLTGHKTEAVYRRYAITSEGDLREGVDRLNAAGTIRG